jgi:hypothetical protein
MASGKKKKVPAPPVLPDIIYAVQQDDGDGSTYLSATIDISYFMDGDIVGCYSLVNTRVKRIEHKLE